MDYLGPDRGVEESMYFRDPNGVGLELYREDLGVFDGRPLIARGDDPGTPDHWPRETPLGRLPWPRKCSVTRGGRPGTLG